jgi:hypothetical protein
MAEPASVAMTRGRTESQPLNIVRTRVDGGVKELHEMTIGRTDDPENPFGAQAFEAASRFVGVGRPPTASMCQNEVVSDLRQRRPSVNQIRACRQLSQQTAATSWKAARKFLAVLSYRVAMARNCLIQQKKFSIR